LANKPWPDEMEMIEPYVTGLLWFNKLPDQKATVEAFKKHLWHCHRFNSCIEGSKWVQRQTEMDVDYHFEQVELKDEKAVEEYAIKTQLTPLAEDHPRWKMFFLKTPAPNQCAVLAHLHHSLGDGLGLLFALSPLMGVEGGNPLSTVPLPSIVLPAYARKQKAANPQTPKKKGGWCSCCCSVFGAIRNFVRGFLVMLLSGQDSELALNEPLTKRASRLKFSGQRVLTRLPKVSLDLVKKARENHQCTLNDIVMAGLTGAIRRYCEECKDDRINNPRVECKSMVMLALPRDCPAEDPTVALQNKMLFSSVRLPVSERTRAERVKKMMAACDDLKSAAYMMGLTLFTKITSYAPRAFVNKAAGETWSKHTFLVTNVPATSVPMTWPAEGGEVLQGVTLVIANVMSQVSVLSYNGSLYASLVADPAVIQKAAAFGQLWQEEMEALADPSKNTEAAARSGDDSPSAALLRPGNVASTSGTVLPGYLKSESPRQ